MSEPLVKVIEKDDYDNGKASRVPAGQIEKHKWYELRATHPEARRTGNYALQLVGVVRTIIPVGEHGIMSMDLLDSDGNPKQASETILFECGMTYDGVNQEVGYLLDYAGYLDDELQAAAQNQSQFQQLH